MGAPKDILHTVLDVLSGRRNLTPAQADELHESLDPGYTAPQDSPEAVKAAEELLARQKLAADYQASVAASAAPAADPTVVAPTPPAAADDELTS